MVSEKVKKKLLQPDICHREIEFSNLFENVSKKIKLIFNANQDYFSIFLTGSGTCAMECIISSCIRNKVLCITNGAFGERWNEVASVYNINRKWLRYNWGETIDIKDVEKILRKDKEIDSIVMVYSETSTGMLNPVNKIGRLAKKYDKLFLVDAISAIAVDNVNIVEDNIDFCAVSSHKGLCSIPGLAIICGKKESYQKIADIKSRNFYCDLKKYYECKTKMKQTPTTPSVQAFYALDEALNLLINEKVEKRIKRLKKYSKTIRTELTNLGFELFLKDHFSNGITAVKIPDTCTYEKIHYYLKKKGFVIYNGKGPLYNKIFHISVMGEIDEEIIKKFLYAVKQMKKDLKI